MSIITYIRPHATTIAANHHSQRPRRCCAPIARKATLPVRLPASNALLHARSCRLRENPVKFSPADLHRGCRLRPNPVDPPNSSKGSFLHHPGMQNSSPPTPKTACLLRRRRAAATGNNDLRQSASNHFAPPVAAKWLNERPVPCALLSPRPFD